LKHKILFRLYIYEEFLKLVSPISGMGEGGGKEE
jgi:hypothetical protein